ncbi:MAG: PAS domain S-box protein [Nitrospiraceae bacterium]|nr:MAG: PAS domain S-box protein [Nitrospiraceae bacterium]
MKQIKEIIKAPKFKLRKNIILIIFVVTVIGAILINALLYYGLHIHLINEGCDVDLVSELDSHVIMMGSSSALIGIVTIILMTFGLTKRIAHTIRIFSDRMMDLTAGNLSARINVTSDDEFGHLASGFNYMAEHIETSLQKIQAAKDYTDNILLSAPSVLIVLSNRMRILSVSSAFDKLQHRFSDLEPDMFINALEHEIRMNIQTGDTFKKEITITPVGDSERLIFDSIISRIGTNSDVIEEKEAVLLTITDVTEQQNMREMVKQAKHDWEDTFDSIPDVITIHNKNLNIIQANKAAIKMLNLTHLSPDRNIKCYNFYHGTDSAPPDCPSCDCYTSGTPITMETYEPYLDKHLEIRTIPRADDAGQIVGLIHIARDISERKKIEYEHNLLLATVTKAKIEWEETFDTVSEFILLIDKHFNIKRCNKSFAAHIGLSPEELIDKKCHDFFEPSDERSLEQFKDLITREESMTRVEVRTRDNFWFYLSHRPIRDRNNSYLHTVVIATNITDLKKVQQELSNSEEELKKKVNDLEKFYDMAVGRELRMKKLKREIRSLKSKVYGNREETASEQEQTV